MHTRLSCYRSVTAQSASCYRETGADDVELSTSEVQAAALFLAVEQDVACKTNSPSLFNPEHLNTDQWLRAAKAMGAKQACLTGESDRMRNLIDHCVVR